MAGTTISTGSQEPSSLNAHMQLRVNLIAEGFDADTVDAALEQMWNEHLPYDDFDEVLGFLSQKNSTKDPHEEEHTAESSAGTATVLDEEFSTEGTSKEGFCRDSISTMHSSQSRFKSSLEARPLGLASKLDIVADYENFMDAVFALTEWTTKVAKQAELEELCEAKETSTLQTIVRRAITEGSSPTKFERSILPSTLQLIGSVLLTLGFPSCSVSSVRKNLEVLLKQARKTLLRCHDDEKRKALAENVSHHIVTKLSNGIREFRLNTDATEHHMIPRLEKEIEAAVASISTTGESGVVELMLNRDMQKEAAEKASVVVGVSISIALNGNDEEGATAHAGNSEPKHVKETKEDLLVTFVGEEDLKTIEMKKSDHETLKARAVDVQSELAAVSQAVGTKLDSYREEKATIAGEIEELRRTIQQLEQKGAELDEKIAETELEAENVKTDRNKQLGDLNDQVAATTEPFEFATALHKLATGLKGYGESLNKAVANPSSDSIEEEAKNLVEDVPRRMGVYLVHARNYFRAEAKCISFLRGRMQKLVKKVQSLERDLEECKALGMKTNASQISKSLSRVRSDMEDDSSVVKALCHEVQMVFEDLLARIDQYISSDQGGKLSSLQVSVLSGILSWLSEIGLESTAPLQAIISSNEDAKRVEQVAEDINETLESDGTSEIATASIATAVGTPPKQGVDTLKTKLTWAAKQGAKTEKTKSLTEIQKEQSSGALVDTVKM